MMCAAIFRCFFRPLLLHAESPGDAGDYYFLRWFTAVAASRHAPRCPHHPALSRRRLPFHFQRRLIFSKPAEALIPTFSPDTG